MCGLAEGWGSSVAAAVPRRADLLVLSEEKRLERLNLEAGLSSFITSSWRWVRVDGGRERARWGEEGTKEKAWMVPVRAVARTAVASWSLIVDWDSYEMIWVDF